MAGGARKGTDRRWLSALLRALKKRLCGRGEGQWAAGPAAGTGTLVSQAWPPALQAGFPPLHAPVLPGKPRAPSGRDFLQPRTPTQCQQGRGAFLCPPVAPAARTGASPQHWPFSGHCLPGAGIVPPQQRKPPVVRKKETLVVVGEAFLFCPIPCSACLGLGCSH